MGFFLHLLNDGKFQISVSPLTSDWDNFVHLVNMPVCYIYVHVLFEMSNILIPKAFVSPSVFESFPTYKERLFVIIVVLGLRKHLLFL